MSRLRASFDNLQFFSPVYETVFDTNELYETYADSLIGHINNVALASIMSSNTQRADWLYYNGAMDYAPPVWGGAANSHDTLTKFIFKIGETAYNAYHFTDMSSPGGIYHATVASQELLCIKASEDTVGATLSGKVFGIQMQTKFDFGTVATQGANLAKFMTEFDEDAEKLTFYLQDIEASDDMVVSSDVGSTTGDIAAGTLDYPLDITGEHAVISL